MVKYRAGPLTGFVIENFDEVQSRTDPASAQTTTVHQDSNLTASIVLVPQFFAFFPPFDKIEAGGGYDSSGI